MIMDPGHRDLLSFNHNMDADDKVCLTAGTHSLCKLVKFFHITLGQPVLYALWHYDAETEERVHPKLLTQSWKYTTV